MILGSYLKDKILIILINGLGLFFLVLYLLALGNSQSTVSLIILVWVIAGFTVFAADFWSRKRHFDEINSLMDSLEQPYLIQELMGNTWRSDDRLYHDILLKSNRAAIEQLRRYQDEQQEYREFLETWIHEVKLPLTGMRLLSFNQHTENRKVELYLTEMDHLVERVLFYARSEQVYQDFQVREVYLADLINQVVSKNKYLLIHNQMSVSVPFENCNIYADEKWLGFILNQILVNAVKYKKAGSGEITFRVEEDADETRLFIRDNGIGIKKEEQEKLFEKGFTGSNGREREKSTGIGLYLCKKLCRKLEIQIGVHSDVGEFTEIYLIFPKNSYISKL